MVAPMSKRQKPPADLPEKRGPMSPAQIASAAFGLAILQAHDDAAGDARAGDAAVYEMLSLLCLESLVMLAGRDPAGFEYLLNSLGIYAERVLSSACTPPLPVSRRRRSGRS